MNKYRFEDISLGLTESYTAIITEEMLEKFGNITGDTNPLHTDEEYAKSKGFSGRVAYGMMTSSLLSTLAGVYLPGERSLIREMEVKFKKPVYIGDKLKITGEVTGINKDFKIFEMKVSITNQNDEKVLRGKMQLGVLE